MSRKTRIAATVFVTIVMVMMLAWSATAFAAVIDPGGGVYEENCQGQCHGNLWGPTKMAPAINFSHGYHAVYQCSSCHGKQFVHNKNGTIKPDMKLCWSCHGLQHGPQGEMATGQCNACHKLPASQARPPKPAFHTSGWAGKPHVGPGKTQFRTRCMMCHTRSDCDTCHKAKNVSWAPADNIWAYDSGDDCMQCHGLSTLRKAVGEVKAGITSPLEKSFQVVGLESSAHNKLACNQCHPDFTYSKAVNPSLTRVWTINSALACQSCHDHEKVKETYLKSVHGQLLVKGDIRTATCASCHGGHDISKLKTPAAKAALHASAQEVCADCHKKEYASYDDYYHGAAYKKGASDAPACWDCHGDHEILAVKNTDSLVSADNIGKTCGGASANGLQCHQGSEQDFGQQAGSLIHQQKTIYNDNVIVRLIAAVRALLPGG
jgi:nitrate/TMAO reductase-like tetraheme cytochrome c subunit